MIYWDREFVQYKDDYMKLFEKCMASQQEVNIEFLEKDIAKFVGRKHAVALQSGTDALYFALQVHDIEQAMKSGITRLYLDFFSIMYINGWCNTSIL